MLPGLDLYCTDDLAQPLIGAGYDLDDLDGLDDIFYLDDLDDLDNRDDRDDLDDLDDLDRDLSHVRRFPIKYFEIEWRPQKVGAVLQGLRYSVRAPIKLFQRRYSSSLPYAVHHLQGAPCSMQLTPPAQTYMCFKLCLLYTSPSPRDKRQSRMPSSA